MSIRIDKKGRRIEIRSTEPIKGLKTTIPGAYLTVAGYWTVPLSIEVCKLLRERFGGRLEVGSELRRWAHSVVSNRRYMAELANADDARLVVVPRVAPRLAKAMKRRKYQRVGTRFIADNPATLVADDPGLGKTLMAMGGILEARVPGPYLVVAPKTAADTVWRREILRWLPPEHKPVILPEFRYQREHKIRLTRYSKTTWLIVHPEIVMMQSWWECGEPIEKKKRIRNRRTGRVRIKIVEEICGKRTVVGNKQQKKLSCGHVRSRKTKTIDEPNYPKLFDMEWGAIIVDESHDSLIRRNGVPTQRRRGLDRLRLRPDGIKLAMSGTPEENKPEQLWGTLNWLDPVQYPAYHRWVELYWRKGGYTGYEIGEFIKEREGLLWDSLSAIALRRTKAEVAPDLPPKMEIGTPLDPRDPSSPVGIWLPMDGQQARAYKEMEALSIAQLESGTLHAVTALAEITRLRQMACAYGDIITRIVNVACYKSLVCESFRRIGQPCSKRYHKEARQFYIPKMPSNKFNWTIENLEEWGYPKSPVSKVVIVSFFTGILEKFGEQIEKHFKTKPDRPLCTAITGRTPMKDRRNIIDRYNQSGNEQIMLLNVKAGGTAITIDTADRMIFISETRIPAQQQQAEDRIHRVSNPRQCMYYYLRSLDTVDVGTALVNQEAIRVSHRLLDGRRGVEYARHVLDLSHVRTPALVRGNIGR